MSAVNKVVGFLFAKGEVLATEEFYREIGPESGTGSSLDHATYVLRRLFGYSSLRPNQIEVLEPFLSGRDTVAVIPTGGGKSMCYVLPAMMGPGLGVVISPLIALTEIMLPSLDKRVYQQLQLIACNLWRKKTGHRCTQSGNC